MECRECFDLPITGNEAADLKYYAHLDSSKIPANLSENVRMDCHD